MKRYPKVNISLLLVDRLVDLVGEGFDLVLRVSEPHEPNLIMRQLDSMRLKAVAAPAYLEKFGTSGSPHELKQHVCLYDSVARNNRRWHFKGSEGELSVPAKGNLVINSDEMVLQMTIQALGIAYLPDFFVNAAIQAGKLMPVLND